MRTPALFPDRTVRRWALLLIACLLCADLPGLDVAAIRNGEVDLDDMRRRYALGEQACGVALACAHAFGAGVPLNEHTCDALLEAVDRKVEDIDALLGDGGSDASGFIDYARSRMLPHDGMTPEGLRCISRAADKGFAPAMLRLARYRCIGNQNRAASRDRLEAAARAGSLMALKELRANHLYDLRDEARTAAQERYAALAEPLLRKAISDTDHESNLAIADVAYEFAFHELCHRIRVAAVHSGLSEKRCKLEASLRALALAEKEKKDRATAAAKPELTPELRPDERAMIAIPLGTGWSADLVRFYARDLLEVSRRHDRRGDWGERIDGLIDLAARFMSGVPGCPTERWLKARFADLLDAGCVDPAIWFLAYSALDAAGRPGQEERLVEVYDALAAQDAPFHLRLACAEMICWRAQSATGAEGEGRRTRFQQVLIDDALLALHRPMGSAQERTLHARKLTVAHRTFEVQEWHLRCFAALKDAIATDDASTRTIDPWLRDIVDGSIALSEGWKVRGRGFASTVSDERWTIFREHLARSRIAIERAYATDPSLPDAAVIRMWVAMGDGEGVDAVMAWLDKAITAAPENRHAYDVAMIGAAPRWGGSPQAIVEVGRRGVATDAYHTCAPLRFLKALEVAAEEWRGGSYPVGESANGHVEFAKPYWPEMRTVLQTCIDRAADPGLLRWHRTALAAHAYKHGHADEVQDLLNGPLRGQLDIPLAEEILTDFYVRDQMLRVAGQE